MLAAATLECLSLLMDRLATVCTTLHEMPRSPLPLMFLFHRCVGVGGEVCVGRGGGVLKKTTKRSPPRRRAGVTYGLVAASTPVVILTRKKRGDVCVCVCVICGVWCVCSLMGNNHKCEVSQVKGGSSCPTQLSIARVVWMGVGVEGGTSDAAPFITPSPPLPAPPLLTASAACCVRRRLESFKRGLDVLWHDEQYLALLQQHGECLVQVGAGGCGCGCSWGGGAGAAEDTIYTHRFGFMWQLWLTPLSPRAGEEEVVVTASPNETVGLNRIRPN